MKIMMSSKYTCGPNGEDIEVDLRFGRYQNGERLIEGYDIVDGDV
jgi:hypothetical protein